MLHIGIDVHQKSSVFNVFDPAEGFRRVLEPLAGRCEVVFEVGPMAQWVAALLRPYAVKITVANPSRIPWLFRDGRKHDRIDARRYGRRRYSLWDSCGTRTTSLRSRPFSAATRPPIRSACRQPWRSA